MHISSDSSLPVPPMRNLHCSLSFLSCSVAAWTFLTHSHGNYSTLCLCSLYFLTASPFKWLCAKLKQAFLSPLSPLHCSQLFSPLVGPLIYPITYSGSHTHTHTCIQTTSCLLCTDKNPLLVVAHSLDYYCTNFCSSSHVLGHTRSITSTVHDWWRFARLVQ